VRKKKNKNNNKREEICIYIYIYINVYIYIYIYINVKTTQTNPIIQQHTSKDTSTHAETDDRQESSNVFPNLKTIQIYM